MGIIVNYHDVRPQSGWRQIWTPKHARQYGEPYLWFESIRDYVPICLSMERILASFPRFAGAGFGSLTTETFCRAFSAVFGPASQAASLTKHPPQVDGSCGLAREFRDERAENNHASGAERRATRSFTTRDAASRENAAWIDYALITDHSRPSSNTGLPTGEGQSALPEGPRRHASDSRLGRSIGPYRQQNRELRTSRPVRRHTSQSPASMNLALRRQSSGASAAIWAALASIHSPETLPPKWLRKDPSPLLIASASRLVMFAVLQTDQIFRRDRPPD